jgi:formyltetrahydrofolate deformylase
MSGKSQRFILTLSCRDRLGIVSKVTTFLAAHRGFILEMAQFGDLASGKFFLRCVFEFHGEALSTETFGQKFASLARELSLDWSLHDSSLKPRLLLLVSKEGHCLNDLLHKCQCGALPAEIGAVVSNHAAFQGLVEWYKIPFFHWPVSSENKREQEGKILALAEEGRFDLVVLARYMQILSPELTRALFGRAINIHHSFLPSFKGAKPYAQAFERGVKLIGATAHYVSDLLDEGPIIEQEVIRVDHTHTADSLKELGRDIECTVLSRAVKYHIERRVFLDGNKTVIFK